MPKIIIPRIYPFVHRLENYSVIKSRRIFLPISHYPNPFVILMLNEYAQLTVETSGKNNIAETKEGLTYFTHESMVYGEDYSCLAVVVTRGADAYWFVQFSTYTKDFYRLLYTFMKWVKTVSAERKKNSAKNL